MNIKRWIARREVNWQRLENLLRQLEKRGLKSLKAAQIKELASLYRSVSADLARARTHQVGHSLIQDLQRLTSRSYSQIYQGSRRQEWQAVTHFVKWGFPALIQGTWGYIVAATLIFWVSFAIAWWYAWQDPVFLELVVPGDLISMVRDRGELWMGSILGVEPLASSSITINNIIVSLRAAIGGVTMYYAPFVPFPTPPGTFTVYILAYNGILIGAIAALVGQYGLGLPFWAFVFPHGALELPAIFLAGGAGLLIARAILVPGQYRRIDALKFYGIQAAQLLIGVVVLLVIAGIIEGFISPQPAIPDVLKYVMGTVLLVLLIRYFQRQR
ncbi:MAG: stage II sporulation protein M [Jaaginema sp. PMC 1079.18]|nr:stage II sporulation protein M [Jaaginema sp. PMC 1080.18]MEC4849422.1 stage II sporulation protein M [Jaaginema sp. PMC 1079.18]MEC4864946.1 stage II sporulation protein M [Jaaginema sp. PMC 1078.18]